MTIPVLGFGQDVDDIDKPDEGDLELSSVTTIINQTLHKEAIVFWASEQAARRAIDSLAVWQAILEDEGYDAALKYIRDARFRMPKNQLAATALGTIVHDVCETYALTGKKPDRDYVEGLVVAAGGTQLDIAGETTIVGTMLNQFDDWLGQFQPSYIATEVCVYSPTYGYAGQCDAFLAIDGVRFCADYKTTREPRDAKGKPRKPYPEQVSLQIAAYRNADFAAVWRPRRFERFRRRYYVLSAAERELAQPVPEVDTGLVIHITPEACAAYPIRCDDEPYRAFLDVLETFRWLTETSNHVMSPQPLQPTGTR